MRGPSWDPWAKKMTVACDFDGVIHSYTSKWVDEATIPDPPVPGVIEWLISLLDEFRIVIMTTRGKSFEGKIAVRDYLAKYGLDLSIDDVTNIKVPALIYIDDRGFRFDGNADHLPSVGAIKGKFRPWNKPPVAAPGDRQYTYVPSLCPHEHVESSSFGDACIDCGTTWQ